MDCTSMKADGTPEMKTIEVPSSKGGDATYTVSYTADLGYWECTCPAFFYRGPTSCKHIVGVRDALQNSALKSGGAYFDLLGSSESGAGWSMELESIMKTAASTLAGYRKAVEAGEQPKTLSRAFLAGMAAALDILTDPFQCPMCFDRTDDLVKELEALTRQNDGK